MFAPNGSEAITSRCSRSLSACGVDVCRAIQEGFRKRATASADRQTEWVTTPCERHPPPAEPGADATLCRTPIRRSRHARVAERHSASPRSQPFDDALRRPPRARRADPAPGHERTRASVRRPSRAVQFAPVEQNAPNPGEREIIPPLQQLRDEHRPATPPTGAKRTTRQRSSRPAGSGQESRNPLKKQVKIGHLGSWHTSCFTMGRKHREQATPVERFWKGSPPNHVALPSGSEGIQKD